VIGPEHEEVQDGGDLVAVHLWAAGGERFVALRVDRSGASESASAFAVESGERVEASSASASTEAPLEHWHVSIELPDGAIDCDLRALSAPLDLSSTAGERRYVQLCDMSGSIKGLALRSHSWDSDGTSRRRRFVSAVAPGGPFVSVAAARPAAATAHGEELVGGQIVDADGAGEPHPLETVRLSTVYDAAGLPRTAGLELYRPGEELPERAAGEAVWAAPGLSFFRWNLAGSAAWGTYEIDEQQ
jgi:hypothetical protein